MHFIQETREGGKKMHDRMDIRLGQDIFFQNDHLLILNNNNRSDLHCLE